jgi:hypothetical protein
MGRLLAYDGAWDDKQIILAQWMLDATTVKSSDSYLAPDKSMQKPGNDYLPWLQPAPRRQLGVVLQRAELGGICGNSRVRG